MENKIFQDMTSKERIEALENNSDATEMLTFSKRLNEEDIAEFNHHLSQTAITQKRLKEEKSEWVKSKNQ
jgi:NAD-specific glutamate dehydrogenase